MFVRALRSGLKSRFLPKVVEDDADTESSDDETGPEPGSRLFVIDTKPNSASAMEDPRPVKKVSHQKPEVKLASSLQPGIDMKGYFSDKPNEMLHLINSSADADKLFAEKCVIKPGFEQQTSINSTRISRRQHKKNNKIEREKTAGASWFNMPAAEMTEENKMDLTILQMRDALDPKRFYKRNSDLQKLPKFFQVGKVVGTQADYHNSLSKKNRKNTLVEELLADAEFKKWGKKKYAEVLKKNPHYLREQKKWNKKKNKEKQQELAAVRGERKERKQFKKHAKKLTGDGFGDE
jgi:hypothetical protein